MLNDGISVEIHILAEDADISDGIEPRTIDGASNLKFNRPGHRYANNETAVFRV